MYEIRIHSLVFLKRLIAFPESRQILVIHLLASPFLALQWAMLAMVPVLLRGHFKASAWQTTIATSAIPAMFMLSVVWSEVYRRLNHGLYIGIVWLIAIVSLGGIALCHQPETMLASMLLSAFSLAGLNPVNGDILRSCYPPAVRSKVYGITQAVAQSTIMASAYGIGIWLDFDNEAFRHYMLIGIAGITVGMALIYRMMRQRLFQERLRHQVSESFAAGMRHMFQNTIRVFREDPIFRRYEIGFLIYGLGWSTCQALLPFLVVDKLRFTYGQVAQSTQVAFQASLILMILPTGYLMDRYGPVRMSCWAFTLVAIYPAGLMLAGGVPSLTLITIWFGICVSAIHLAWTIGPITLAPTASDASNYLAIHATLVGPRTIIGQFSAIAIYLLTGRIIAIPLCMAVACFIVGALLMHLLHRRQKQIPQITGDSIVAPIAPSRAP